MQRVATASARRDQESEAGTFPSPCHNPLVCKANVYIFIECSGSNWSRQALEEEAALEERRAPAK